MKEGGKGREEDAVGIPLLWRSEIRERYASFVENRWIPTWRTISVMYASAH